MGDLLGSLNWHTTNSSSEVILETNHYCHPDWVYEPIDESIDQYANDTGDDYDFDKNETNHNLETTAYQPHLDELLGWYAEEEKEEQGDCNTLRLWKTTFNETNMTTRIYKNAFVSDTDRYNWKKLTGNPDWTFIEEKISLGDHDYEYSLAFPDSELNFSVGAKNISNKTILNMSSFLDLDMEIDQNNTEKFKTKLQYGSEKILDGWFYNQYVKSYDINDIVHNTVPGYLKSYFEIAKPKEYLFYLHTIGYLL